MPFVSATVYASVVALTSISGTINATLAATVYAMDGISGNVTARGAATGEYGGQGPNNAILSKNGS